MGKIEVNINFDLKPWFGSFIKGLEKEAKMMIESGANVGAVDRMVKDRIMHEILENYSLGIKEVKNEN